MDRGAVAFVVVIVAAGRSTTSRRHREDIGGNVSTILGAGAKILENTTRLRLLVSVYGAVVPIRTTALHINEVCAAIAGHGKVCRHCPACVSPRAGDPVHSDSRHLVGGAGMSVRRGGMRRVRFARVHARTDHGGGTALLLVVAGYVIAITRVLRNFGAREGCDLEKIVGALKAIVAETAILNAIPEVNKELRTIGAGLQSIDGHLITFVQAQE